MNQKDRIDVLLLEKGLVGSRQKAQALIMAGQVYVNNEKMYKSGSKVNIDAEIEIRGEGLKYVSRGGLKLEKAIKSFNIDLNSKKCMDVGASTGGFTDCMLQNGAQKVYAVDVGYGQFAWKLRQDKRVIVMERTNIRFVKPESVELLDFVSIDVSFISLRLVLPVIKNILKEKGEIVCLIKPQFEAGRDKVGKKGVVRDKEIHKEVIENIIDYCEKNDFEIQDLNFSPIRGPEGNIEYLLYLFNNKPHKLYEKSIIQRIVDESHTSF
jgi:23S rRNA (cytidine1920-2'-O)/16S rRNA (cytidine1409-2'-O)-methyltransferase